MIGELFFVIYGLTGYLLGIFIGMLMERDRNKKRK